MQLNLELPADLAEALADESRARGGTSEAVAVEAIRALLAGSTPARSWASRFVRRLFSSGPRTMGFAVLLFAWANLGASGLPPTARIPACLAAGALLYVGVMELFDPLPERKGRWDR